MRVEALYFKRCCCCLPLRYGLLATGYLKLFMDIMTLVSWTIELVDFLTIYHQVRHWSFGWNITVRCFGILLLLGDTALAVVFVIGGHKKDPKLLKIYNNYSIGMCVLTTLLWLGVLIFYFVFLMGFGGALFAFYVLRSIILLGFLNTCLQIYLIFLTRSEILKLENSTQFSFTNNANEAECAMIGETGNYDEIRENDDTNLKQSTLVNDDKTEEEKTKVKLNDDDEVKHQKEVFIKHNASYSKLS